jgi:hypothetical protein
MRDVLIEKMGNNSSLGFKGEGSYRRFNMMSDFGEGLSQHGNSTDDNSKGRKLKNAIITLDPSLHNTKKVKAKKSQ